MFDDRFEVPPRGESRFEAAFAAALREWLDSRGPIFLTEAPRGWIYEPHPSSHSRGGLAAAWDDDFPDDDVPADDRAAGDVPDDDYPADDCAEDNRAPNDRPAGDLAAEESAPATGPAGAGDDDGRTQDGPAGDRPAGESTPESGPAGESGVGDPSAEGCPETAGLRRLLEDGAAHLGVAREAGREQARQAGVQARALAAFAGCRPAAAFDRPAEEIGAAAAASRAARPAALTEVSEWAVDEVAAALGLSARTAGQLLADSILLAERLPATLEALEDGAIGWPTARMLAEVVGPVRDEVRGGVEAGLLARAGGATLSGLRAAAVRAVLRADAAAAAARLAAAVRDRAVRLHAGEDGMATLAAVMTGPVAAACHQALEAYAQACLTPGDPRSKAQRMADCLAELILRPGELPPVRVQLTAVAPVTTMRGGDEPGEIAGMPVPAVLIRELAYTLGLLPRPPEPETAEPPAAGPPAAGPEPADAEGTPTPAPESPEAAAPDMQASGAEAPEIETPIPEITTPAPGVQAPTPEPVAPAPETPEAVAPGRPASEPQNSEIETPDAVAPESVAPQGARPGGPSAGQRAAADLAALLGWPATAGTALAGPPAIAIVEEISGQLLALTDGRAIRRAATCADPACRTGRRPCPHPPRGAGLGPPADSPGYTPGAELARFVRFRDRRCRFPGCRARAIRCDLDHTTPWPLGDTAEANLCCLCRHHHRLRHQAPGWTLTALPDGGLAWTLPGGATLTTYPPRFGTDDPPPPPAGPPPTEPPPPPGPTPPDSGPAGTKPPDPTPPGPIPPGPTPPDPTPPGPIPPGPTPAGHRAEPSSGPPPRPLHPPLTARERVCGRPLPPGETEDDPAPF